MNALSELDALGFEVGVIEPDTIRVQYRGPGEPDPQVVRPLLEAVRREKAAVLRALRAREAEGIFRAALQTIKGAWLPDLLGHIERRHPDHWGRMVTAQDELERLWIGAEDGAIPLEQFRSAVTRWRDLHLAMAEEHAPASCAECPDDRARACREWWRERDRKNFNEARSNQHGKN